MLHGRVFIMCVMYVFPHTYNICFHYLQVLKQQRNKKNLFLAGRYCSVGSDVAWESRSILASRTSFHEDLVMKIFLRPFFLFRLFKKSICQLMAKRCALNTGNLLLGGLPRSSVDGITDRPDMTSAINRGRKASTQTNKQRFSFFAAFI